MTARALILAPFAERQLARLRGEMEVSYESWLDTRRVSDPDILAARIRDERFSMLVVEADFVFEDTLDICPSLKFIGVCRSSVSHVDVEAATERGVAVVNAPGRNARAVAEHALALMLALARRIPQAHHLAASGEWRNPAAGYADMRGIELGGRTLGIIGLGATGGELARICAAIGMRVLAYDPFASHADAIAALVKNPHALASESDFVSVHAPATPRTAGMICADFIARMKRGAYIINCADAAILDMPAVVDALASGRIAGAAFDVFETHPIAPDNPLLALGNAILTPHIGGATEETVARHSAMMADDMLRFVRGIQPVNLVNPKAWHGRKRSGA